MASFRSLYRWWIPLQALVFLGVGGCPTSMGCGVSGTLPNNAQRFEAQTWTCQASIQLAKGASIASPDAAKAELVAKKETTAVQVASLRDRFGPSEERGFGFAGKDGESQDGSSNASNPAAQELSRLKTESEELDRQIQQIDSLEIPKDAVVLKDGIWTVDGDHVTFRSVTPYTPGQKVVVPYVVRSAQGEIVKAGYMPVESIRVVPEP